MQSLRLKEIGDQRPRIVPEAVTQAFYKQQLKMVTRDGFIRDIHELLTGSDLPRQAGSDCARR